MKKMKLILTAIFAFTLGAGNVASAADGLPMMDKTDKTDFAPVLLAAQFTVPQPGQKRWREGWAWIHYMANEDNRVMLDNEVIRKRVPVDTLTKKKKETALHIAAWAGHERITEMLIGLRANVNAENVWSKTPLHKAAAGGHRKIVKILLKAGADINATDGDGSTPLHQAMQFGKYRAAKLLIEKGADKEAKTKDGKTPLWVALERGHVRMAQRLNFERMGLKTDYLFDKQRNGRTRLHAAVEECQYELARGLYLMNLDKSAEDYMGYTPLHLAAYHNCPEIANYFIAAGADMYAKPKQNREETPFKIAHDRHGRLGDVTVVFRWHRHQEWLKDCRKRWGGFAAVACPGFNRHLSG